jgi:peptidoglycan/LPS O-acetylase OafA/YrhL
VKIRYLYIFEFLKIKDLWVTKVSKMDAEIQDNQRIFGLDVVRAIAILMVVFSHIYYLIDSTNPTLISISGISGFAGVELFFVLSGFLIGTILLKKFISEEFSIKTILHFLKRRWFRTLPNYYLVLILNLIIALFFGYPIDNWLSYFFFMQNFASYSITIFTESWSLSVEEWTYVFVPIVLFFGCKLFKKNKKFGFLLLCGFLIVLFHLLRFTVYMEDSFSDMQTWNLAIKSIVIYRIDSIIVGFVIAWLHFYYARFLEKYSVYLFIIALHLFFFQFVVMNVLGFDIVQSPLYVKVFYFTLTSFTIALGIPVFVYWNKSNSFFAKPIELISRISYSMYLLHYSIVTVLFKFILNKFNFELSAPLIIVIYLFATIFISYLLYKYFEKPMMNLRDK